MQMEMKMKKTIKRLSEFQSKITPIISNNANQTTSSDSEAFGASKTTARNDDGPKIEEVD